MIRRNPRFSGSPVTGLHHPSTAPFAVVLLLLCGLSSASAQGESQLDATNPDEPATVDSADIQEPLRLRDLILNPPSTPETKEEDAPTGIQRRDLDVESLLKKLEEEESQGSLEDQGFASDDASIQPKKDGASITALLKLHTPVSRLRMTNLRKTDPTNEERRPKNTAAEFAADARTLFVGTMIERTRFARSITPSFGAPPAFCHRPLYFEQANLERCGNSCGWGCAQNTFSFSHFFYDALILPINVFREPARCTVPNGPACNCSEALPPR